MDTGYVENDFTPIADEILLKVILYLSPADLLNTSLVSKRWNAVTNDPMVWRRRLNSIEKSAWYLLLFNCTDLY
jgi:hypothetical protein